MKGRVTWFHIAKYQAALLAEHINANYAKGINATAMAYNAHLPHEILVYPPKIYLPTLIIVTVGPLASHREWNVFAAQPSTDARQQRFQRELTLFITGLSQLLKEVKWFLLFPTMTEVLKPTCKKKQSSLTCQNNYTTIWLNKKFSIWHQLTYYILVAGLNLQKE